MKSILITGAAGGIGRALAIRFAGRQTVLYLSDIDAEGLKETVAACGKAGGQVRPIVLDVSAAEAVGDWVKSCGQLDLVLACAGIQCTSLVSASETARETIRTIEVNLLGVLNTALPALELMAAQKADATGMRGQIVVLASQGAFVSVPGASAYCASKAAVDNWAVGRGVHSRDQGIYITSVCPGYVRTPMTKINDFPMHGLMDPARAAEIIATRLVKRPVRIVFPLRMYLAARLGGLLPAGFPARMLARNYARKQAKLQKV